jgi:hypothetical protein
MKSTPYFTAEVRLPQLANPVPGGVQTADLCAATRPMYAHTLPESSDFCAMHKNITEHRNRAFSLDNALNHQLSAAGIWTDHGAHH